MPRQCNDPGCYCSGGGFIQDEENTTLLGDKLLYEKIAQLRAHLRKYARHTVECPLDLWDDGDCTCGFSAVEFDFP